MSKFVSYNAVIIAFIAGGLVSIGISSWQYTSGETIARVKILFFNIFNVHIPHVRPGDSGNTWHSETTGDTISWTSDVCDKWPFEYVRRKYFIFNICELCI